LVRGKINLASLPQAARELLEGKNFAFLATLNKDGSPQVTPTWVGTDGKNVLINVATYRQKFKNVSRDPRVAVTVIDMKDPYKGVIIRGKVASITRGREAEDQDDELAIKYTGHKHNRKPNTQRALLKIEPTSVVETD
jgi:PPOX class probable F420-dependent enzyme